MGLEYGNWLYTDTPKDNFEARVETMPFDPAPVPWKDEHVEGYKNFVRFMVRHFKGRVYAWELWNEPLADHRYGWGNDEKGKRKYAEILNQVIPVIREEDPDVKIMGTATSGQLIDLVAPHLDIIDLIRYYEMSQSRPEYRFQPEMVAGYKEFVRSKGFRGEIFFSQENQWWGLPHPYPDMRTFGDKVETTEMGQAKDLTRTMVRHAGHGIIGFWNETWNSALTSGDVGLLRHGFNAGPAHNMTVRPVYYAYRTICTVLADAEPVSDIPVELSMSGGPHGAHGAGKLEKSRIQEVFDHWTFRKKDGTCIVALRMKGDARGYNKGYSGLRVKVGLKGKEVFGLNTLNGTQQKLNVQINEGQTTIHGLVVYDYPLFIRIHPSGS
jgi:hypothetical protein